MTSVPPPGHDDRPGESWGWAAPGQGAPSPAVTASSTTALDPLSRRLLQLAGALSALLIVLVAYTWMRGDGEHTLNPIAEAAARTEQASGARSEIHAVYAVPAASRSVSMHGEGLYNGKTGRSQVTLVVSTPAGEMTMEAVGEGRTVYLRSKLLQPSLPPGEDWMAIETGLGRSSETSFASSSGPGAQLELLHAVTGDVETVDKETIDGVETTRYRGSFDLPEYARFLHDEGSEEAARQYERLAKAMPSTTEVETWVDGDGLVRRMRLTMEMKDPNTGLINTMDMTEEFTDFGIAPDVQLPDPESVFDATLLTRAELGLIDGSSEMPSLPPAGSPLSPRVFQAKAKAVCVGVERRLKRLAAHSKPLVENVKRTVERDGLQARSTLEAFRVAVDRYYEPSAQALGHALDGLARIAPPAGEATDFHRLLRLSSLQVELIEAGNRAVQVGKYSLSKKMSGRLERLSHRTDRIAGQLGLDECESGNSTPSGQPA